MKLNQSYKHGDSKEYSYYVEYSQEGVSLFNEKIGIEGIDNTPAPGDTVTVYSNVIGSDGIVDFKPQINNNLYYLVSDDLITDRDVVLSQATIIPVTFISGRYVGSFVYNNPQSYRYLYIVSDYTNNLPISGSINYNFTPGQKEVVDMDLDSSIGVVKAEYSTSFGPFRIAVEYNGFIVADSGEVLDPGAGILSFVKTNTEINKARLIFINESDSINSVSITNNGVSLTSFYVNKSPGLLDDVCSQAANTNAFHNGSNALPKAGDTIYEDSIGSIAYDGDNSYHVISSLYMLFPSDSSLYVSIDNSGVVTSEGSCVCYESGIPVIEQGDITIYQNQSFSIYVEVTNNPKSWTLITDCNEYTLYGGPKGAIFTYNDCNSIPRRATVSGDSQYNICASIVPTVVNGSGSFNLIGSCQESSLPNGIQFKDGVIFGKPVTTGRSTIQLIASNCFGSSIPVSFDVIVQSSINLTPLSLDVKAASKAGSIACLVTPSYSMLYHNGKSTSPVVGDTVYLDQKANDPFVGGNLWFQVDDTIKFAVQIDQLGVIIDKFIC